MVYKLLVEVPEATTSVSSKHLLISSCGLYTCPESTCEARWSCDVVGELTDDRVEPGDVSTCQLTGASGERSVLH